MVSIKFTVVLDAIETMVLTEAEEAFLGACVFSAVQSQWSIKFARKRVSKRAAVSISKNYLYMFRMSVTVFQWQISLLMVQQTIIIQIFTSVSWYLLICSPNLIRPVNNFRFDCRGVRTCSSVIWKIFGIISEEHLGVGIWKDWEESGREIKQEDGGKGKVKRECRLRPAISSGKAEETVADATKYEKEKDACHNLAPTRHTLCTLLDSLPQSCMHEKKRPCCTLNCIRRSAVILSPFNKYNWSAR